ncbi:MAG TPA: type II toxin-antitoxin system RelE/ParE family toxin [Chthonomonadaceae bacterium]|nr:type II toxin-antitoxin system RelE/ParE family toxin [Chthonomonadaceae bacterium]
MSAELIILPVAEAELLTLPQPELRRILMHMDFLCEFPRAAQAAEFAGFPDLRRAVSGNYLIYYAFDAARNAVRVYTVRHAARTPLRDSDIRR